MIVNRCRTGQLKRSEVMLAKWRPSTSGTLSKLSRIKSSSENLKRSSNYCTWKLTPTCRIKVS